MSRCDAIINDTGYHMLNWKNLTLSGDQAKALETLSNNSEFNSFVESAITSRESAIKESIESEYKPKISEFRNTNVQLKEQLEKYSDFDADEYHKLKQLGSQPAKANEAMQALEQDYKAQLGAKDHALAELTKSNQELTIGRQQDGFKVEMNGAISKYNAENPTMPIAAGAEKQILRDALDNYKLIGDKYVMQSNGEDFKGDGGFGTMSEWIANDYVPQNQYVVQRQSGTNAAGSSLNGGSNENLTSTQKIAQGLASMQE